MVRKRRPEWDTFSTSLREIFGQTAATVERLASDEVDLAEGLRVFLRDLRMSIERRIEEFDSDFPYFMETIRETYHLIADTADYAIFDCFIDGRKRYRICGNVGLCDDLNFTASGSDAADSSRSAEAAFSTVPSAAVVHGKLEKSQLALDAAGNFEIIVSGEKPEEGDWLETKPGTNRIIVRNIFHAPFKEHRRHGAAKLTIERIDGTSHFPRPLSEQDIDAALKRIVEDVSETAERRHAMFTAIDAKARGRFVDDRGSWGHVKFNPRTWLQQATWELAEDEAMVIDLAHPVDASFWVLAVTNCWMEAQDFRFFPSYVSKYTAKAEADGAIQIVLAPVDLGYSNWIHTAGHRQGALVWRWNDIAQVPELPSIRIVKLADLLGK